MFVSWITQVICDVGHLTIVISKYAVFCKVGSVLCPVVLTARRLVPSTVQIKYCSGTLDYDIVIMELYKWKWELAGFIYSSSVWTSKLYFLVHGMKYSMKNWQFLEYTEKSYWHSIFRIIILTSKQSNKIMERTKNYILEMKWLFTHISLSMFRVNSKSRVCSW